MCLAQAGDKPATNVAKCAAAQGCLSEIIKSTVKSTALAVVDPQ